MTEDAFHRDQEPLCPSCRQLISETLRVQTLDAVHGVDGQAQQVDVVFCGACGTTLSAAAARRRPGPPRVPDPADPESLEGRFQLRCRDLIEEIQRVGFTPGGWIGLIEHNGAVGAARELLAQRRILPVTPWLVAQGRPDLTMEHEITTPTWAELFDDADRAEAERRLEEASSQN